MTEHEELLMLREQLKTKETLLAEKENLILQKDEIITRFLEDGRLVISNNLCEAHIRPFATARKAWLFADTPKGAFANGVLYTLAETAKQNDLNVFNYLDYLLKSLPNIDFANHPDLLDEYLPWSEQLPAECRLTVKTKKQLKK